MIVSTIWEKRWYSDKKSTSFNGSWSEYILLCKTSFSFGWWLLVSGDGKHSLSIDLGFIAGHVKRKSNSFKLNENLASKPERITVSQIDTKWFLSIGYLLKL